MNLEHLLTILVLGGQLLNVFLFLRIRIGQLEVEKRVLDQVEARYQRHELCTAQMDSLSLRITRLEKA